MHVIGVIDVRAGRAVHAVGGNRDNYMPIQRLGQHEIGGSPCALAAAYRERFGLDGVYVADLDGIIEHRPQTGVMRAIAALPLAVWVDAGISSPRDAETVLDCGVARIVVGLETLSSYRDLEAIVQSVGRDSVIFSLDLKKDELMLAASSSIARESPVTVASHAAACGIETMIVLDVARVGLGQGPALSLIAEIRRALPHLSLIAGGGVRGWVDLRALAVTGCAGALVATALQDERLSRLDCHRSTIR